MLLLNGRVHIVAEGDVVVYAQFVMHFFRLLCRARMLSIVQDENCSSVVGFDS